MTAKAADGPDYLNLPLAWTPTRRFDHHQVYEYQLALGAGNVAILRLVADKGWAMTIVHDDWQPDTDRGLFGTPHDALMVLVAEFVFGGDRIEDQEAEADPDALLSETRKSD
jgi:2-hydroxychromene-2-carboxylate isomerase